MDRKDLEVTRLNEQIADLKAELVELSGKLQSDVDEVQRTARPAIGVIRDNPGTVSSVAVTAGLVGLAVGYMLGSNHHSNSSWR
jgi:hypothetical protein